MAEQGNANAQYNLGYMYATGEGVIQDNVTAHMWWNIVAVEDAKGAIKNGDTIAKKMTPAAIKEAQRRAKVCVKSNYKNCD